MENTYIGSVEKTTEPLDLSEKNLAQSKETLVFKGVAEIRTVGLLEKSQI